MELARMTKRFGKPRNKAEFKTDVDKFVSALENLASRSYIRKSTGMSVKEFRAKWKLQ